MILLGGEVNSEIERAVAERELARGAADVPPEHVLDKIDISDRRA